MMAGPAEDDDMIDLIWAKTGPGREWMCLRRHLLDAAAMADAAWDAFVSPGLGHAMALMADPDGTYGEGRTIDALRALARFSASIHDVGKANPVFQYMIADGDHGFLCDRLRDAGLAPPPKGYGNSEVRHEMVSGVSVFTWALSKGCGRGTVRAMQSMVAGHHGFFESGDGPLACATAGREDDKYNVWLDGARKPVTRPWSGIRGELVESMYERVAHGFLDTWKGLSLKSPIQVIMAGLVVAADWMASDRSAFPTGEDGVIDADGVKRAATGLAALGIPGRWHPPAAADHDDAWFRSRFPSLPKGAGMNPMQRSMVDVAGGVSNPPLIICESGMGSGKTEAALAAAEILAGRFGCDGVSFALPTKATTDAMFPRFRSWMHAMGADGSSMALSHGDAWLNPDWRRRKAETGGMWTDRGRMRVLSSFHVSTIDRLLNMSLRKRHVELDHLGFAGKVVIMDEMHSADEYMLTYVERALQWLAAYHTPVIILTATLRADTRSKLVKAWSGSDDTLPQDGYPLITVVDGGDVRHVSVPGMSGSGMPLTVRTDGIGDVPARVMADTADGGCAAVIMNTVGGAQDMFSRISGLAADPSEVMLLHSRFCSDDRHRAERRLLGMLGPDGSRPHRLIVIGTQVIEQSLDIDFDFMYTQAAPMENLLQRAGRLQRHPDSVRPALASKPVLHVFDVPDTSSNPPAGGVNYLIYGKYRILASDLTVSGSGEWSIPGDIPGLIAETYDDRYDRRPWAADMKAAKEALESSEAAEREKAMKTVLKAPTMNNLMGMTSKSIDSDSPGVRDGIGSLHAILVADNGDGTVSPVTDRKMRIMKDAEPGWGTMAALQGASVPLPPSLSNSKRIDDALDDLRSSMSGMLAAWDAGDSPMHGEHVVIVDGEGRFTIAGRPLSYDATTGITETRR